MNIENPMSASIHTINPENYREEVISESKIVLLLCMPRDDTFPQQRRIVEEIARRYSNALKVVLPDEAFIEVFKRDLHITGTPTILILNRGKEISRVLGMTDGRTLNEIVLDAIGDRRNE